MASPYILYQIWLFVAPALYKHERSAITGFLFSTVFLFLAGIAFGYYVPLPYALKFLVGSVVAILLVSFPLLTLTEISVLLLLFWLATGLLSELPVLISF